MSDKHDVTLEGHEVQLTTSCYYTVETADGRAGVVIPLKPALLKVNNELVLRMDLTPFREHIAMLAEKGKLKTAEEQTPVPS